MLVNGEAITGSKVWRKSMEGSTHNTEGQFQDQKALEYTPEDFRFTVNHGNIYAICMKCPGNGQFLIKALKDSTDQNIPEFHGIIEKVDVLGYDGKVEWKKDGEGLHVSALDIKSDYPVVIRVNIK
jgi:alpha-L-fucosidase